MTEPYVEWVRDRDGYFRQKWLVEPPPPDVRYVVLEDEWDTDYRVRTIKRIEVRQ